ncbi:hypothetical protein LSAT2_031191 [Lamellibrachia satsuma]|nr:hypothetical protein LSAT2_031191 [Lamellibrachia satsuma]
MSEFFYVPLNASRHDLEPDVDVCIEKRSDVISAATVTAMTIVMKNSRIALCLTLLQLLMRNISQDPCSRGSSGLPQTTKRARGTYKHHETHQDNDPIVKHYAHLCSSVERKLIRGILPRLALRSCKRGRHKAREKNRCNINHSDKQPPPLLSKLPMPDY